MARKLSGGLVGQPSVGAINVAPTAVMTAAQDQNITISPVGAASIIMTNNVQLNAQNDLRFADTDSSNWVAFQGPATVSSNVTWTLPATDGTSTQALTTDGSGVLSWATNTVTVSDELIDSGINYVAFTSATSGAITTAKVSSTKLQYQPSTGTLTSTVLASTGNTTVGGNLEVTGTVSATFPVYLNATTIDSYTIPSGTNAMSAGPITIAAGQTVTVNGDWSVV
jgi:hypothetical protein